jgi:hypothetical protein
MTTSAFIAQPYPLYAVTYQVMADESVRVDPAGNPVHLVVGWVPDDDGLPHPALASAPGLVVWTGAIAYYASREEADEMAADLAKAARSGIRHAAVTSLTERLTTR